MIQANAFFAGKNPAQNPGADRAGRDPAPDPVRDMMEIMRRAGRPSFQPHLSWETCLCALVMALEPHCKTYRLLEALPYHTHPLDESAVMNAMAHLGYFARSAAMNLHEIDARLIPCLFVPKRGKPAVILSDKNGALGFYKNGRILNVKRARLAGHPGKIWMFERFDENRPRTSKFMRAGSNHGWSRALLGRFGLSFRQVLLAGLALNVLALASPLFTMLVYDRIISSGSPDTLPMLALGAALAAFFEWRLRLLRSRGLSWLAARMDNIVGNRIFAHLIGLPPDLIERASVSAQIARVKTFEAVRDFFSGSVFLSLLEMPFTILAALSIWAIAGPLVLVPLGMIFVYAFLFHAVWRKVRIVIRLAAKASSARQQFTMEAFEKLRGIRGYGLCDLWESKFRALSGRELLAHFHLNWLGVLAETLANALTLLSAVATVSYGAHLIWAGSITAGALVATMILVWRVLTPFYSLCTMIPRLEQLRNSILQVDRLMEIDTEAMEARAAARLPALRGRVSFASAALKYADEEDFVFSQLSFEAGAGAIVVVKGESGSGKSSLLKLIKGLHRAREGSVRIDGFDLRQLDLRDLRRQIAYIPQHHDFFEGTILENLRLANPLAAEDEIWRALKLADAAADIEKLSLGLETRIARHGASTLPPALAVRISLARAYLHPAPILLIDELPQAVLGSRAGKNLKEYISGAKGRRTVFIVTYREDFVAMADAVIALRRGGAPSVQIIKGGSP